MKHVTRIFLLLTGTLLLAHYLPAGYWLIADERQRVPTVFYSCVEKRFLFFRSEKGEILRTDADGKTYEREEFEGLLPFDNYMQLYKDGRMPKEIDGVAITPEKLRRERLNVRLKPEAMESPSVKLTPLLESQSGRVRLEMPDDFMRFGKGIEFVDAKSNRVLSDKSARFERAFAVAGFVFPVKCLGGNPSTLKPYDEGYFLVDSAGAVFHLRQVGGEPALRRITDIVASEEKRRWEEIVPRYIHVQEQDNREVRALIIGQDGRAHLVVGKDYRLVTLPFQRYNPATTQLTLRGDLLNRLAVASSADGVEAIAMTRDFELMDRYSESLPARTSRRAGRLAAVLFPFTLDFASETSGYLGFHLAWGDPMAVVLNLVLVAGLAGWWWLRERRLVARFAELTAVMAGGLFGLVIVTLLPRG